jgi:hypothetical protein
MALDELQYIDRDYVFTAIPAALVGGVGIRTANDDKNATSIGHLSFTVNIPVTVFVAHDDRITPRPDWLTSDFTATGEALQSTDGSADSYSVFKRDMNAGQIVLGGNVTAASDKSMYSVVVVAQ